MILIDDKSINSELTNTINHIKYKIRKRDQTVTPDVVMNQKSLWEEEEFYV